MLIEFNVKNFRSFWEPQSLKMTAAPSGELQEQNTFSSPVASLPPLLCSSVVYGPNASGKSNFIQAFHFMREFVLNSAKESQEGEAVEVKPFLFNRQGPASPSEMEALFIHDGVRYQYGFAATRERVVHEWLFAFPQGRIQRWFERSFNPETQQEEWYFGSKFTGKKSDWQKATRANALFLSTAIQLNNEQLKPVFYWFRNLTIIRHGDTLDPGFSMRQCQDEKQCRKILDFMNAADISIADIAVESKELMKEQISQDFSGKKILQVEFQHAVHDGGRVSLPLEDESDGTRKLFAYAGPCLDVLNQGRVLIVDELNNSLHPHIVRFLLRLFHSSTTNSKNSQLIFSTHDTSILDKRVLRRDQIWFVEKNDQNASHLYPLSDFRPRKEEALEKGYLQGRYGALPYIGEVKF